MRIIEIVVSPKGEAVVQTKGYAGSDCLHASKFLEQALGCTVAEKKTADYFQTAATQQQTQA